MKSSFKSTFEKHMRPDGSVELVFPQSRINASHLASGSAGNFAALFLLLPSCAVTSPVLGLNALGELGLVVGVLAWAAASWWLTSRLWGWVFNTRGRITVVPGEGLRFAGKQLPFSEIRELAVMNEQATGRRTGQIATSSYLYASAHGQEIRLTRHIPAALGETLLAEIGAASGGALS